MLAISDDHRALTEVARGFLHSHDARGAARAALEATDEAPPPFWPQLCALGWLGLHLPEEHGGQGAGLPELAVVLAELGRVLAPGPFLPTVLASAVLDACAGDELRARLLPGLADGSRLAAVGLDGGLTRGADGAVGGAADVLGGGIAEVLLLPVGADVLVVSRADAPAGLRVDRAGGLDPGRRVARVVCDGLDPASALAVLPGARATVARLARTMAAAELAGLAEGCRDMSTGYAKQREQFGRLIGTFQAVKHMCADVHVAAERAIAVAWDAARAAGDAEQSALAAATAATIALPGAVFCAQRNIQLHGGIGFTWEHDAHLFLRRARSVTGLLAALGDPAAELLDLVAGGTTRRAGLDLPPAAEQFRAPARAVAARVRELPPERQRVELAETGYLMPHWPPPWGRSAGAVEQLVIEEEFAGLRVPDVGITGWVVLTIAQHGNDDQRERWVAAALDGRDQWCQLFSEPGAGSDAAAVGTRAVRTDGGWLVTGQKVWTTGARQADRGFATVRTSTEPRKHDGISMMAIDLHAKGVEVRPLREITGGSHFNEVFFDEVFVPDADVVGEIGAGWRIARATLGNERVSIGGGASVIGMGAREVVAALRRYDPDGQAARRDAGRLIADEQAIRMLNLRRAAAAVAGADVAGVGAVTKLLAAEHSQHLTEWALDLAGPDAVTGRAPLVLQGYLYARAMTIAGGTSEIVRSQIAERVLGLPRDPLLR